MLPLTAQLGCFIKITHLAAYEAHTSNKWRAKLDTTRNNTHWTLLDACWTNIQIYPTTLNKYLNSVMLHTLG